MKKLCMTSLLLMGLPPPLTWGSPAVTQLLLMAMMDLKSDGESGDADSDADGAAGSVRSKGSNKAPRIPDMDKEHVFEALCFYMAASTSIYILLHIYHLIQNHV
jgi:hypothetical protein